MLQNGALGDISNALWDLWDGFINMELLTYVLKTYIERRSVFIEI